MTASSALRPSACRRPSALDQGRLARSSRSWTRQLRLLGPQLACALRGASRPAHLLAVGESSGRRSAPPRPNSLHLEMIIRSSAGILRTVEQLGHVRRENVPCGRDTHSDTPHSMGPVPLFLFKGRASIGETRKAPDISIFPSESPKFLAKRGALPPTSPDLIREPMERTNHSSRKASHSRCGRAREPRRAAQPPVLVIGERGTVKELIAERLHHLSSRWSVRWSP